MVWSAPLDGSAQTVVLGTVDTKVDGGWKGHQAPHLNGRFPSGGNLLMADGHGEWRRFDKMRVRTDGDPTFWW